MARSWVVCVVWALGPPTVRVLLSMIWRYETRVRDLLWVSSLQAAMMTLVLVAVPEMLF